MKKDLVIGPIKMRRMIVRPKIVIDCLDGTHETWPIPAEGLHIGPIKTRRLLRTRKFVSE